MQFVYNIIGERQEDNVLRSGDLNDPRDDLFAAAHKHLAAAAYASHALPLETFLLAMLLEEHKEVVRLRQLVETRRGVLDG